MVYAAFGHACEGGVRQRGQSARDSPCHREDTYGEASKSHSQSWNVWLQGCASAACCLAAEREQPIREQKQVKVAICVPDAMEGHYSPLM